MFGSSSNALRVAAHHTVRRGGDRGGCTRRPHRLSGARDQRKKARRRRILIALRSDARAVCRLQTRVRHAVESSKKQESPSSNPRRVWRTDHGRFIDGLEAAVATARGWTRMWDAQHRGTPPLADWQKRLPTPNSAPYTVHHRVLVRRESKGDQGWADLVRRGSSVITPNPRPPASRVGLPLRPGATRLKHNNTIRARGQRAS